MTKISDLCLYSTKVYLKVKVIWRSRSSNVKVISNLNHKNAHVFSMFYDLCVTRMVRFRLKSILVLKYTWMHDVHRCIDVSDSSKLCDYCTNLFLWTVAITSSTPFHTLVYTVFLVDPDPDEEEDVEYKIDSEHFFLGITVSCLHLCLGWWWSFCIYFYSRLANCI